MCGLSGSGQRGLLGLHLAPRELVERERRSAQEFSDCGTTSSPQTRGGNVDVGVLEEGLGTIGSLKIFFWGAGDRPVCCGSHSEFAISTVVGLAAPPHTVKVGMGCMGGWMDGWS